MQSTNASPPEGLDPPPRTPPIFFVVMGILCLLAVAAPVAWFCRELMNFRAGTPDIPLPPQSAPEKPAATAPLDTPPRDAARTPADQTP